MSLTRSSVSAPIRVRDLGRVGYGRAERIQRWQNARLLAGHGQSVVLLLEHDPVITVPHRPRAREHLIASDQRLRELGIEVAATNRGGDITYHGPGQLVAYPILRLGPLGLNLSRYMRWLEQVVIDTLAVWGVAGQRVEGATGVWVATQDGARAKVCAMGVRIRRNTTLHGLALNVAPDMTHFGTIVPCGLHDAGVTSLAELLGDAVPPMAQVKHELRQAFERAVAELVEGEGVNP